jgi:hypothetical protein
MYKKKNLFNKNSIPFLLLAILHVAMIMVLLKHKKQKDVWILLLSNIGFAYLFEYPTLNLFHGYRYKPKIIKRKIFDSVLGAIFSQAFYVPIAATFLTLLKKNWKWKINFSIFYFCIELLFLKLNIYKVNWWKPVFTPVLLNVYFYISDGFKKALSANKKWAMVTAHYLAIEVIWVTIMFISALNRYIRFGSGFFRTWNEHFKIVPLYSLILSSIATLTSAKDKMYHWLLLPLSHIIIDAVLVKVGILKIKIKHLPITCSRYLLMPFISRLIYNTVYKNDKGSDPDG